MSCELKSAISFAIVMAVIAALVFLFDGNPSVISALREAAIAALKR